MNLSTDAIIFGLAYLRGPKSKLSFGGEGAEMAITFRARSALDELIAAGYAEVAEADDQIKGRQHYRGTMQDPFIGELARAANIDPFASENGWSSFSKIDRLSDSNKPTVSIKFGT